MFGWWLFDNDFDSQVWTAYLAEHAADARLRSRRERLIVFVHFQYVLGTKMNANAAPLAPFAVDEVFLEFPFHHEMRQSPLRDPTWEADCVNLELFFEVVAQQWL